jgi:hypothetical protein
MRIGFLYNHDQIHQIAHSLPIALALSEMAPGVEVIVAVSNVRIAEEVARLAGSRLSSISLVQLKLESQISRAVSATLGWAVPATKLLLYRDNLKFFRSLDALVVTERTSLLLKTRYGLQNLKIILADHGAGDRAIGFDAKAALFDHILAAGPKIRDRMVADAGVDPARISITGYPKFDLSRTPVPSSDPRPLVLYNPHVSPHLSSWYKMGREVLEYFYAQDRYRLIFAPHIMLFQRKFVISIDRLRVDWPGTLDPKFALAPHIQIDCGSRASTDMSYTNAADIYLGDVSSQVYEYMISPRPCVFLDAHQTAWEDDLNYAHWQAGPVIRDVAELGPALERAQTQFDTTYRPVQQRLFDYTFNLTKEPSATRAAQKLLELLA